MKTLDQVIDEFYSGRHSVKGFPLFIRVEETLSKFKDGINEDKSGAYDHILSCWTGKGFKYKDGIAIYPKEVAEFLKYCGVSSYFATMLSSTMCSIDFHDYEYVPERDTIEDFVRSYYENHKSSLPFEIIE